MKAIDVVEQLQLKLPKFTDAFTTDIPIKSLTRSVTIMTAVCNDPHNLSIGHIVIILGAIAPIPISSLIRVGAVGTLVTVTPHDLTDKIAKTIQLSGSVEAEFNGTFTRLQIKNRTTITFTMVDSGPTTATGSPVIENAESILRNYNQTFQVSAILSNVSFQFIHPVTSLPDPIGTIIARSNPRISAAITIERAQAAYTKMIKKEKWMFVILDDSVASKSRQISSDAVDNLQRGTFFRQQVVQSFEVFVFFPVQDELAARESRDQAEDLFRPICRSVLSFLFDSGLFVGAQNPVQFVDHGVFKYDTATYIHSFAFQNVADLTFNDTVGPEDDVAFRDIDLTIFPDPNKTATGISFMDVDIDLDKET